MSEAEEIRQQIHEAFEAGYKASEKDIPKEKVLPDLENEGTA